MVEFQLRRLGAVESAPKGSLTQGTLVGFTGIAVATVGDPPMGIVLDDIATDSPPNQLKVHGKGANFHDDTIDGIAQGQLVFSDGDGTYSTTEPAGVAGTLVWILGIVREFDTVAANQGATIEITLDSYEKGA